METQDKYIPGVCNIGRTETKRRAHAGWIGLFVAIILYGSLIYLGLPRVLRLILFFPAMMAAVGFLQARMHFCAYFGMRGVFNFSDEIGKIETVEEEDFRAMDKKRAQHIIIYSVTIGIIVAIAAYFLPP
jgi:hypothetical protein